MWTQTAQNMNKVLVTPEPHYIPGYAGFCPQLKYSMGRPYGRLTGELLSSPALQHSRRLLRPTGQNPSTGSDTGLTPSTIADSDIRMIPGYTGFVPKRRNYFACSYSETCRRAMTEFHQERRDRIRQRPTCRDLPLVVGCSHQPSEKPKPPLTPRPDAVFSFKPFTPEMGNPHDVGDDNLHKYHISGFKGHVPTSRFLFGKGYPSTTNQALIQFRKRQQRGPASAADGAPGTPPTMPPIYPSDRGAVPSFTGHIPGYKFTHGHTFGRLSQNALQKSGIRRNS